MDIKEIKKLIKLVEEASISELCIEEEGTKIDIKKELSGLTYSAAAPQQVHIPQQPAAPTAPIVEAEPTEKTEDESLIHIKAQMVGTFYGAPNPDAAPYVKVGDKITKGQTICIIEAMKLFNEIEAEVEGTIEKITCSNGDPVEYGQILFSIRP